MLLASAQILAHINRRKPALPQNFIFPYEIIIHLNIMVLILYIRVHRTSRNLRVIRENLMIIRIFILIVYHLTMYGAVQHELLRLEETFLQLVYKVLLHHVEIMVRIQVIFLQDSLRRRRPIIIQAGIVNRLIPGELHHFARVIDLTRVNRINIPLNRGQVGFFEFILVILNARNVQAGYHAYLVAWDVVDVIPRAEHARDAHDALVFLQKPLVSVTRVDFLLDVVRVENGFVF